MSDSEDQSRQDAIPDLLDVNETAAILRVGHTYVYESTKRFLATGAEHEIPAIKVGRLLRIPRVALERFIGAPITWPIPIVEQAPQAAVAPKDLVEGRAQKRVGSHRRRSSMAPPSAAPRLFES